MLLSGLYVRTSITINNTNIITVLNFLQHTTIASIYMIFMHFITFTVCEKYLHFTLTMEKMKENMFSGFSMFIVNKSFSVTL